MVAVSSGDDVISDVALQMPVDAAVVTHGTASPPNPTPVVAAESGGAVTADADIADLPVDTVPSADTLHESAKLATEPTAPATVAPTRPKVLVIGQSHLGCVNRAYGDPSFGANPSFDLAAFQMLRPDIPYVLRIDGKVTYNPVIAPEIEQLLAREQPDLIVLMIEGQQTAIIGFTHPAQPYDFALPGQPFEPAWDAEVIPYHVALTVATRRFGHIGEFLRRIKPMFPCPVVALAPPPVIGENVTVLSMLDRHDAIREAMRKHGVPPPLWRWKIWRLHVTALAHIYQRNEIPFHEPPAAAFQDGRFLQPALVSDPFHGNPHYGAMLLRQIDDLLATTRGA